MRIISNVEVPRQTTSNAPASGCGDQRRGEKKDRDSSYGYGFFLALAALLMYSLSAYVGADHFYFWHR